MCSFLLAQNMPCTLAEDIPRIWKYFLHPGQEYKILQGPNFKTLAQHCINKKSNSQQVMIFVFNLIPTTVSCLVQTFQIPPINFRQQSLSACGHIKAVHDEGNMPQFHVSAATNHLT